MKRSTQSKGSKGKQSPSKQGKARRASLMPPALTARAVKIVRIVALVALLGVIAFFPVALATDQPSFCRSCHGMTPFYDAWVSGGHKNVWCIDCHVEPGYPNRFSHKFVALQEVYAEIFTHATYPNYNAEMPDSRCRRCHPAVATKTAAAGKFSHPMHLARGLRCARCHADVGHRVTFAALADAGVLNRANAPAGATFVGQEFIGSAGKHSALAGHKPVVCSNCHDQANLQCSVCHAAPANHFGADCKACHRPGVPFAQFTHPPSGQHSFRSAPCAKCHPNGLSTVFCTCHGGRPPTD